MSGQFKYACRTHECRPPGRRPDGWVLQSGDRWTCGTCGEGWERWSSRWKRTGKFTHQFAAGYFTAWAVVVVALVIVSAVSWWLG